MPGPRRGRRDRARWARRLLVLGTLLLAACKALPDGPRGQPATPQVRLLDLRLHTPPDGAPATVLRLAIDNPNPGPIVVDSLRTQLVLNGTLMGVVEQRVDRAVPAASSGAVDVRFDHPDAHELARLRRRMPPRGFAYRITGEARAQGQGLDRIPFRLEGERRLP